MRLAITGSTGHVGYFLARALCEAHDLDCWTRPGPDRRWRRLARLMHPRVTYRDVDLSCGEAVSEALRGVDGIVHLAYSHVPGRYRDGHGHDLAGWLRANLDMHLHLLLGAQARGVRHFVLLSSRAVYGAGDGPFHENDLPRPDSHYGSLKAASELLMSAFDGMRHCALRSTGVYGCVEPVESSKWFGLVRSLSAGVLPEDRIGTEVHGRDLARVVALLLDRAGAWPQRVNVSDLAISHSMIADVFNRRAGRAIDPRPRLGQARGVMACDWLASVGFVFGGVPLFEETVGWLMDACEEDASR